jgi:hypothetical protein
MPATYEPIATTTTPGGTNTVTFSSIPATYTDLVLVVGGATYTVAGDTPYLRINGDTGTNYSGTVLSGNGTSAQSTRRTSTAQGMPLGGTYVGSSTTVATNLVFQLLNYANTTTFKTGLSRYFQPAGEAEATVALWRNTAAVTSILYRTDSGNNIGAGAVFTLYGIKAA